jgi:hypothetical protein
MSYRTGHIIKQNREEWKVHGMKKNPYRTVVVETWDDKVERAEEKCDK